MNFGRALKEFVYKIWKAAGHNFVQVSKVRKWFAASDWRLGSAKETAMEYVKSERDTELKNELRKGDYVVRAPAMKPGWVVA